MEALVDCVVELAGGPGRAVWVIEADGGDGAILIGELLSRDELVATLTPTEVAARGRVAATEQAETAVRTAMRGEPRAAVHQAMRHAVRDAVFLVDLVIRLNLEVEKSIRIEGLRYAPPSGRCGPLPQRPSSRQAHRVVGARRCGWSHSTHTPTL